MVLYRTWASGLGAKLLNWKMRSDRDKRPKSPWGSPIERPLASLLNAQENFLWHKSYVSDLLPIKRSILFFMVTYLSLRCRIPAVILHWNLTLIFHLSRSLYLTGQPYDVEKVYLYTCFILVLSWDEFEGYYLSGCEQDISVFWHQLSLFWSCILRIIV